MREGAGWTAWTPDGVVAHLVIQNLVAAAAYAGMVLAAAGVAAAECRGRHRALRGARQLLIAWVVGATLLAGVSQRDLWPLSSWSLMTRAPRRDMGVDPVYLRLLAVDDAEREYPVDYRAVEPFAIEELMAWMRSYFLKLPRAEQDSVAGFLLRRLNVARARVRAGDEPGTQERWLGPLRAPVSLPASGTMDERQFGADHAVRRPAGLR